MPSRYRAAGAISLLAALLLVILPGSASAEIERHPLPDVDAFATSLQFEPGGDLRFYYGSGTVPTRVGRLTPAGALSLVDPGFFGFAATRTDMTRSPDGALWAAELYSNGLDRLAPDGTVTRITVGPNTLAFTELATGPDGAVYSATQGEDVFRHSARQDGSIETKSFDGAINPAGGNSAYDLAFLNGRIYLMGNTRCTTVNECVPARLVEIDPAAAPGAQRRETPIPALNYPTNFEHIVTGPDGRLWVQDQSRPRTVHRFTPAGADAPLTLPAGSRLAELEPGSDGTVVARTDVGAVARIRPDGTVREWCPLDPTLVTRGAGHDYLVEAISGPGGATWFSSRGDVGRVTLDTPPLTGCAPQAGAPSVQISEDQVTISADVVRGGGRLPKNLVGGQDPPDPEIPNHGVRFEIGRTTDYGRALPVTPLYGSVYQASIADLEPGATYHVRVVATTRFGTAVGPDAVFTTPPPPGVAITGERILDGYPAIDVTIDPAGENTGVSIEYGPSSALGTTLFIRRLLGADGAQPLTVHMTGGSYDLRSKPEFHYRIVAENTRGATRTEVRTIQVPQQQPPPSGGSPPPPTTSPPPTTTLPPPPPPTPPPTPTPTPPIAPVVNPIGGGVTPPPARRKGKLSAQVTKADLRAPFNFTTSGRLTLPSGVAKSAGCTGRVSVQVKRGSATISTRRVTLRKDCTYSVRVTFKNARRFRGVRSLKFTARFVGNTLVSPTVAPARFARVRR